MSKIRGLCDCGRSVVANPLRLRFRGTLTTAMTATISQLRTFVAVAETGSVRAAAERLYVSQPSVSAAIGSLRRDFGLDLFEPHGRGIRLTPAGSALVPYVIKLLGLLDEATRTMKAMAHDDIDVVRVAAGNTAGDYLLPALLQRYDNKQGARISLQVGTRQSVLHSILSLSADIGITGGSGVNSDELRMVPCFPNELIVVGKCQPPSVRGAAWLIREEGCHIREWHDRTLADLEVPSANVVMLGSGGAIKRALLLGLGVSLVSRATVGQELFTGRLVEVETAATPISDPWVAITLNGIPMRPVVRQFWDYLQSDEAKAAVLDAMAGVS